jgi:hypothetical protein
MGCRRFYFLAMAYLNALSLGFKMLFDLSIEPVTNNFVALMKGIGANW